MDGIGCQPVFSVLIASALSEKPVDIHVRNPGETAYIDLLLYWFEKAGLAFENLEGCMNTISFREMLLRYLLRSTSHLNGRHLVIPYLRP